MMFIKDYFVERMSMFRQGIDPPALMDQPSLILRGNSGG